MARNTFQGDDVASTSTMQSSDDASRPLGIFGRGTLSDIVDDMVIYRNLVALDGRLPKLKTILRDANVGADHKPRKQERDYARVAIRYAQAAQKAQGNSGPLGEFLMIGDSLYSDGHAFTYLQEASGWQGSCFIGSEFFEQEAASNVDNGNIYSSNRWSNLGEWIRWNRQELGLKMDSSTVAVIDIDKTALGARGRNDSAIDQARLQGAARALTRVLGQRFDLAQFETHFTELNQPQYHGLTLDNQDYVAYICLVLSTGLFSFEEIRSQTHAGSLENFEQFTRLVETRMMINPAGGGVFREAHDAVLMSVRNGDPTPFKSFRRQEFICTIEMMGQLADDTPLEQILAEEIVLTQEICELVPWLRERNVTVLCLSDKPDEASCPHRHTSPDLQPVHRTETHRVGTSIRAVLESIA